MILMLVVTTSVAKESFEYKAEFVKDGIHMLSGSGGNIAVLESEKGLLVVDNGFERNSAALDSALDAINVSTRFVLNTHWHGDHTGANAMLADEATVMAHANVRIRMAKGAEFSGGSIPPADAAALPTLTYEDGTTLYFGDQTVKAIHLPSGHTDGDTVVYFTEANVFHTGDLMFANKFPFIDIGSGGDVDGYINNVSTIIDMIDEDTTVIPGHGPISKVADVIRFRDMIVATRAEVAAMQSAGLSLEEAQAQGLEEKWASWGDFFIKEDRWIATLW
ncbi:MAG: MBL fold metallo-hydrolase [Pseudomonadota bacterium]